MSTIHVFFRASSLLIRCLASFDRNPLSDCLLASEFQVEATQHAMNDSREGLATTHPRGTARTPGSAVGRDRPSHARNQPGRRRTSSSLGIQERADLSACASDLGLVGVGMVPLASDRDTEDRALDAVTYAPQSRQLPSLRPSSRAPAMHAANDHAQVLQETMRASWRAAVRCRWLALRARAFRLRFGRHVVPGPGRR